MPTTNETKTPTAAEVAQSLGVTMKPALTPVQVQRLRKALPGYVGLLDDTAELLARDAGALNVTDLSPDDLLAMQAEHRKLAAAEATLKAALESVYHQRMQLDSDAMGAMQKLARRVQSRAEEAPELPVRWKTLLDFLGTFRTGGRAAAGEQGAAPDPVK